MIADDPRIPLRGRLHFGPTRIALDILEARSLIEAIPLGHHPQRWLDLGCGEGVFTRALATLLPTGSSIEAWDLDLHALSSLPKELDGVLITPRVADFLHTPLPKALDGILIANALHYVADHRNMLKRIVGALAPGGIVVIGEYDTETPAPIWVPHPISQKRATALLMACDFDHITPLQRRTSAYGRGDLYTIFAQRSATSDPK